MAHDDAAFLARSPNRVAVLGALAEEPMTRRELRAETGASRVTVGRVTTDLERRDWVRRTGQRYRATAAGRAVVTAFERLLDTTATTRRLAPLFEHLPLDAFDFEVTRLRDAEVVVPTPTAPARHVDRLAELFRGAGEVWMVVHAMAPRAAAASYEAAAAGDHVTHGVVTPNVLDAIRETDEVCEQIRELLAEGAMRLHVRPAVPYQFGLYDETAALSADDDGVPEGIVVSTDAAVTEWTRERYDALRGDATPVAPEDL
ncbi:helix-turn-helix transcriptional regulator [Halosegnis marinus]|uniref:Helix-turn-helix transcriptional regulator n=1 Tax=Halosegnis marinus TaxID=3034023 RepID=A0ABD5ZMW5_9EURY|nr:ArsR family transcriptional regulator [Halosegnis sp. DT85]